MAEKNVVAPAVAVAAPAPLATSQPERPAPVAAPGVITVDVLAGALRQVMGEQATSGNAALTAAMTDAVRAAQPRPKITVANRQRFNPNNPTNRVRKLRTKFFQNYFELEVDEMSDEVYDLLNSGKLKSGGFMIDPRTGPLFEVLNVKRGSQIGMHLRYNNSTINHRMQIDSKVPGGLAGILRVCIKEAEEQAIERKRRRDAGLEDDDE